MDPGGPEEDGRNPRTTTLDDFLDEVGASPDWELLVVDVEGLETEVFDGFSISRWRPQMMVVEILDAHPDLTSGGARDHALQQRIADAGYDIVYKDEINTVFVRDDVAARATS